MIAAAQRKRSQAEADVRAAQATIRARQAAADAAKKVIDRERAGLAQARAGYESVATQKGYAELKAETDGIVSKRHISPGTVVSPGQAVLQISQVSPIRLQANVPQSDLESIRVGSPVTIVSDSGKEIKTTVRSISPALDPQSRTATVEAIYANQDGAFRPGQFLRMTFETGGSKRGLILPQQALQTERLSRANYVWRATPSAEAGQYRVEPVPVEKATASGEKVMVTGLRAGDEVVISGITHLREGQTVVASLAATGESPPPIEVSASGFSPSSIEIPRDRPTTLQFVRVSEDGCGEEVVFPDLGIRRKLPLNEIVQIELPARPKGSLKFSCGMDMLQGKVVVR